MNILGISAFYHDSAAAIIVDGKIIAAVQEERFSRIKNDPSFPTNSISFCLKESNLKIDDLDAVVFYDKPFLKFERLIETYYQWAPKGLFSFIKAMTTWLQDKLFLKSIIRKELKKIEKYDVKKLILEFSEHHLSHAASTYFTSPFVDSAILTIDGVGEWTTTAIYHGKGNDIRSIQEIHYPHSLGLLYSAFTYFLGFKVNSGEYKLMGLAPYGDPKSEVTNKYINTIKSKLIEITPDGSFRLNEKFFTYSYGDRMVNDSLWEELFRLKKREPESQLNQEHCNLAYAIQKVTEEVVVLLAKEAKKTTQSNHLCLAGGVALNCVANGVLEREKIFDEVFIQPAAGDAGGALGAALISYYLKNPHQDKSISEMNHVYFGPEYTDLEIEEDIKRCNLTYSKLDDDELYIDVAKCISEGKAIGWFQGRMEFGPRSLGNRSILGDPTNPETQLKLNLKVKKRESFRPFAPAILKDDVKVFFPECEDSPFMLKVFELSKELREELPSNYSSLTLKEKLYCKRSNVQSITHVDFSGRVQTVEENENYKFYQLLKQFKKISGKGILVNTSFNVRGESMVCSPNDAIKCFLKTDLDILVMNNFILRK